MASFHDEITHQGVYPPDDDAGTYFSVQGCGTGELDNPCALTLNITTGNVSLSVCEITMKDLAELGRWLTRVAEEKLKDSQLLD